MNKEEFGKWDLREAKRFLECFCKVECSEETSYPGENSKGKEFSRKEDKDVKVHGKECNCTSYHWKNKKGKGYDRTSCDSKGNDLKGSENSCGRINIRVFSDKKGTGFKGKNLSFNMKDFPSKSKILMAHNEANRGIFFVVNSGGNSDRKINKINAQFFECDTLSLEEQMENISKFPLEPSIIVQTKKSLHVYFLIKNGKVEKFRDIQKKLAKHFNGDGSCINESRVMRVPGFYHCKEEPVRVKCIKFNPNLFYTQEDLERELSYSESEFIVNDDNYIRKEETNKTGKNLSRGNLEKEGHTRNNLEREELTSNNLARVDSTRNLNKESLKWLEPTRNLNKGKLEKVESASSLSKGNLERREDTRSLNEENFGELECTRSLLSEISDIGIEKNSENLESYISNYHSNLQESTLLNKENISEDYKKSISEKKSEGRNNKSKEQVLYESEENFHSRSEDNISKNRELNIKDTEDSLPRCGGQDSMNDAKTSEKEEQGLIEKGGQASKEEDKQVFRDNEAYFISGEGAFRKDNEDFFGKSEEAHKDNNKDSLGKSEEAHKKNKQPLKSRKESFIANKETTDKNGQASKEEDKQAFRDDKAYFISGEEVFREDNEDFFGNSGQDHKDNNENSLGNSEEVHKKNKQPLKSSKESCIANEETIEKGGQATLTTSSDFYKLNGDENLLNGEAGLEGYEESGGDEEVKGENGLEVVCFKCDFIRHCKKNSKTLSEPLWHGMITNLALFKGGAYRIHELSKDYKTYSEKETEEKISNFLKSGAGPMTCETLRDRGYPCKRYGKTCYGKSPASLAFKPLTVKDIRECIKFLRVSEVSNATNVDTALRFIENYMYNIGVALGKSLIEEDLAKHLKIKNPKDLISFYREVIKNFKKERGDKAKGKNHIKPKNFQSLPWYEEQEKGLKFLPFVLAKHLSETRDVYYGGESFLIYENGVYNISGEKEAGRIIMDYMLPNYCTMASIRDCRDQWDILVSMDFDVFNRNPYLVNVRNGLLDIRDMSFKEHTPSYLSTVQLNVEYNPHAHCPQFEKFLNEVLDCRLIPLVQEILGYLLTTNTSAQKSFVLLGPARTGKSTLLWVVEYLLLGKKNVSNIPWQEIGDKFKTAELLGKLANVFSDLPSKSIDDTGIFKVVTGEDYLMAEKKNKNPFKFRPFARLVFSCNELPKNYVDRTEGFYRRLIIVPFNRQIDKNKIDKALKYKFQREKEGIFNWALEGLKRLYENNFEFSENELTDGVKKEYKRENNNVISFVEECCEIDSLFSCSRIEIYEAYKEFCVEAGLKALSQIKFNKELEGNFNVTRARSGKLRLWNGVRIKLDDLIIR
ncbi:phage/plasmid primase, P4 family [Clostridium perfringens]|nr:phage/plasmid primase, P4 family [Clostridium perfringens]MDM0480298.1 phage/plasmid primase, P4 family [Clostridium perfringens]MDM0485463.1 phage/plasmid primase, P4 family [Clostridium perfringens]